MGDKIPPPENTPVLCWHDGHEQWPVKRYSTGQLDRHGNLLVFADGRTSWSARDLWDHASFEFWSVA